MKSPATLQITCPKCKRESTLTAFWVLSFSFDNLAPALAGGLAVALVALGIGFGGVVAIVAAVVTSLPLLLLLVQKHWCDVCEIEFKSQKVRTQPKKAASRTLAE